MTPSWRLEIFDSAGATTTTVEKSASSPHYISGSMEAVAAALPSITGLARFFHDPDLVVAAARAAYTAFAAAWETTYGITIQSWEDLMQESPTARARTLHTWTCVATAASAVDPALN